MPKDDFSAARDVFDNNVEQYSETIEQYFGGVADHDFFIQSKVDILRAQLDRLNLGNRQAKFLDVGCGIGLVDKPLSALDIELHGVDISQGALAQARSTNPAVHYQQYDGAVLPYEDAAFDLSFAIGVMHHVPPQHWPNFIAQMKRVTRPGGLVVVIEHNPLNPATQWVVRRCPLDEGVIMLTQWEVKRLCKEAGLTDLLTNNVLFTPFKPKFFRALDRHLRWLPFGTQYFVAARVDASQAS